MQINEVKAFRQRLVRAGFYDVWICNRYDGAYTVECSRFENGIVKHYKRVLTVVEMVALPRVVWFE